MYLGLVAVNLEYDGDSVSYLKARILSKVY